MTEEIKTPIVDIKPVAKTTARKAAPAKAETFEAFSIASIEMPEAFREATEKGVKQAKDAYEKMRTAAEEATDAMEDQIATAKTGMTTLSLKALDNAKASVEAPFQFAKDLMAVKTFAEVIELQTAFARSQFELASGQAKDFQALAQKVATDSAAPVKDVFGKFMKDIKAA